MDANKPIEEGIVKYISDGLWHSKMVVSYVLNGDEITEETRGSECQIEIPSNVNNN